MRKIRTSAFWIMSLGFSFMGTICWAQEAQYKGFPVSLNLKEADIVTVLHVLAEEAGLNLVVGEDVKGKIDVHLVDVPWDQALEEILRNKGLVKRQVGNVLHVLTIDGLKKELEKKELLRGEETKELEARQRAKEIISRIQQEEEMARPLETRTFFIRYAKAAELQKNLQPHLSKDSKGQPRGSIEVNEFANVLVVRDIPPVIEDMEELLRRLDRPTPQVLIEARIVEVNTDAVRDLGIQWGGQYREEKTSRGTVTAIGGARGVSPDPTSLENITEIASRGFAVNLPAANPVLGLGITLGRIVEGMILDIQLTAMEAAGRAHVLSRPKIVTMDNQEAIIKRGEDIPYVLRRQANEVPDVQFKEAKLQLKVRPHVIGEDRLAVEVSINNDARTGDVVVAEGSVFPIISRQEAQTRALVKDGDTMVLGGIIRQERRKRGRGVPFLQDLPLLSWLFRSDYKSEEFKGTSHFHHPQDFEGGGSMTLGRSQGLVAVGQTRIGSLLVEKGLITEAQLQEALRRQQQRGGRLGQILIEMKAIAEEEFLEVLAKQLGVSRATIPPVGAISPELLAKLPEQLASRYRAVPIALKGQILHLAMADPFDIPALDDLRVAIGFHIKPHLASEREIQEAIERYYRRQEEEGGPGLSQEVLKEILQSQIEVQRKEEEKLDLEKIKAEVEEAPVVRLVDYVITNAIKERASDIHIEPREDRLDIRYRIDGILHHVISPPRTLQNAVISRIKILADMDIAERRLPQDGRFTIKLDFREVDLRVSTLPTSYGEKIVIRLLRKGPLSLSLEDLGFDESNIAIFRKYIHRPYGLILLTGPTGSGKTTTLYAALSQIASSEKNIVTVEDPVEYQLKGVYQMQANPSIGLTFAVGLRAILRQDPDVIMVGEIRDYETAEMAVRAALTGHLVFSTLHTNDAVGTIVRLLNMGIEPFLVCSALTMSVAQRLVRKICPECKEPVEPTPDMLAGLGLDRRNKEIIFYRGRGCPKCKGTGYFGRTGIFEILEVNQRIKDLILQGALPETIHRMAVEQGMVTLKQCAVKKVLAGITTFSEVLRVCIEED